MKGFLDGHRYLTICDEDEFILNIVGPSVMVQILSRHLPKLDAIFQANGSRTVKEIISNLKTRTTITIGSESTMLDAVLTMYDHDVDLLGVVNKDGALVSHLHRKDLRVRN
jgi:CBS domain-containing protein